MRRPTTTKTRNVNKPNDRSSATHNALNGAQQSNRQQQLWQSEPRKKSGSSASSEWCLLYGDKGLVLFFVHTPAKGALWNIYRKMSFFWWLFFTHLLGWWVWKHVNSAFSPSARRWQICRQTLFSFSLLSARLNCSLYAELAHLNKSKYFIISLSQAPGIENTISKNRPIKTIIYENLIAHNIRLIWQLLRLWFAYLSRINEISEFIVDDKQKNNKNAEKQIYVLEVARCQTGIEAKCYAIKK